MNRFRKLSRVWLQLHRDDLVATSILAAFVGLVAVVGVAIFIPSDKPSTIPGVVTGFGMRQTEEGSYRVMTVRTDDGIYTVRAPVRFDCRIGDQTKLRRSHHWWGKLAGLGLANSQPCARPPLPQQ